MGNDRTIGLGANVDLTDAKKSLGEFRDDVVSIGPAAEAAGQQASDGLQKVADGAEKAAAATSKVAELSKAGWSDLGRQVAAVAPELGNLADQAYKVQRALDSLGKAGDSPDRIERSATAAQAKLIQLQNAIEAAEKAGVALGPEVAKSIESFQAEIQKAVDKAGQMKEVYSQAGDAIEQMGAKGPPALNPLIDSTGKASSEASKLTAAMRETAGSESELGAAAGRVQAALDRMAASADSPRGLAKATQLAVVALQDLDSTARKAGVDTDSLRKVEAAVNAEIEKATTTIGRNRKALTDIGAGAKLAGDQTQTLAASMGSLDGMFGRMRDTGTGWQKTLAGIGLATFGVTAMVKGAIAAGEGLGKAIDWVSGKYEAWLDKTNKITVEQIKFNSANDAVSKGLIAAQPTREATIRAWERYAVAQGIAGEALYKFLNQIDHMGAAANLTQLATDADTLGRAMAGVFKHSWEETQTYLPLFKKGVDEIIQNYATLGKEAPAEWLKVQQSLKATLAAQQLLNADASKGLIDRVAKIREAAQAEIQASLQTKTAVMASAAEKMKALNAESTSDEEYSRRKKEIAAEELAGLTQAVAADVAAKKKQEQEEGALRTELGLSKKAWDGVTSATDSYLKQVANGVPAYEAIGNAAKSLVHFIDDSRIAIANYGKDMKATFDKLGDGAESFKKVNDRFLDTELAAMKARDGMVALRDGMKDAKLAGDALIEQSPKIVAAMQQIGSACATANGGGGGATPAPAAPAAP